MTDKRTAQITFSGDIDFYRRDEIAAALPPAQDVERVVIDMRDVDVIDSSFVSVLMRYRRAFVAAGRAEHDIVLVVSPNVRRMLEITGLTTVLTVVSAAANTPIETHAGEARAVETDVPQARVSEPQAEA